MVVQTYLPDDPVIRAVAVHDRSIFAESDLEQRAEAAYPPFVRLSNVLVWGADEVRARQYIESLARELRGIFRSERAESGPYGADGRLVLPLAGDPTREPVVLGPSTCVIERAKDRYRFHLLVKSPLGYHVSRAIGMAVERVAPARGVHVSVDIDAYDLM